MVLLERYADRIALDTCTILLMVSFTILRFWQGGIPARQERKNTFMADVFASASLVFCTCCVIGQVALFQIDSYRNFQIPAEDEEAKFAHEIAPDTFAFNFFQSFLKTWALWFLKGAYISSFVAMSSALPGKTRKALYGLCIFWAAGTASSILIHALWCRPISANWNLTFGEFGFEGCSVLTALTPNAALFAIHVTGDVLIAGFSVALIRNVKLNARTQRVAYVIIFAIGFLSIIASVGQFSMVAWMFGGGPERSTANNFAWRLVLDRLEVIFGTCAYGLAFAKKLLGIAIKQLQRYASTLRSLLGSGSSNGASRSQLPQGGTESDVELRYRHTGKNNLSTTQDSESYREA